ncbi:MULTISPECIES: transglutaminase TgpA family protein [Virgibacillus]|uniref:Protein-glutamine gamma-glutamyltransferase n=1 Tax=Virgibacillus massiliensis TaxID=1462526 RepID=A0A024QHK6_9BACI|nr:transglutaminase domain-containing protein [Virgibacillus massiliensis]CDQ41695.1 Protein-glutamine gamma-glutamyltransferase [Virgibacillus massiliensis]
MMKYEQSRPIFFTSLLYICGYILFLEWLYPLEQVTDTHNLTVFVIYSAFCFVISLFQIKWWLSFILKGVALLFIVNHLFFETTFLSPNWMEQLFLDIGFNMDAVLSQAWYQLTPMFRSVLFLLLIWLMSYLLHYWFVVMKKILLFVLLTFVYLAILDTFTVYNGALAIIRAFIISFIALGVANFSKEMDREAISFPWMRKSAAWMIPIIAIVAFSSAVGFAAPKYDPQWPDPVPFIQSSAENAGIAGEGSVVQKVGYGEDDTRLGGSFVQDYTPVFQAKAEENHYWRIETKDVYTGKGWTNSSEANYVPTNRIPPMYDNTVDTEELEATIEFQGNTSFDKILHPYGFKEISTHRGNAYVDLNSEAIQLRDEGFEVINDLNTFTVDYDYPTFNIDKLRETPTIRESLDSYTQLPETLPERVKELAKEITAGEETAYDKVKAIEQYFSTNGFTYQTTDVPVPKEGQDYVDQFLFDSKVGYCDNYSTAMVVLLRSIDIPARWAKGFTGGEEIDSTSDYNVYEVTNANAHSWVEVFFPEIGWVPFEPTQGFSNLSDFQTSMADTGAEQDDVLAQQDQDEQQTPEETPQPSQEEENQEAEAAMASPSEGNSSFHWLYLVILLVILALLVFIGYRTRFRWKTIIIKRKFMANWNAENYQEAYHYVMKLLRHRGDGKLPDETLREYAVKIDRKYSTDEMKKLTQHYEQLLYRQEIREVPRTEIAQLWQNLIKRILA